MAKLKKDAENVGDEIKRVAEYIGHEIKENTELAEHDTLKEVFEKHIDIARVSKEAGNYEQLVESYIRASAAATFLELIKKKD